MKKDVLCPHCGKSYSMYRNPTPTTDVLIYEPDMGVVLIERKNPPYGYAIPGGFIDEGETAEHAARREMREETGLDVDLLGLLGVYSDPLRDPRLHTISTVYVGKAKDPAKLHAGDDARTARFVALDALPQDMAFDHKQILEDFLAYVLGRRTLAPCSDGGR